MKKQCRNFLKGDFNARIEEGAHRAFVEKHRDKSVENEWYNIAKNLYSSMSYSNYYQEACICT